MQALTDLNGSGNHALRFYENEDYVCDVVASFLADALHEGRTAFAVTSASRRASVEPRLEALGIDVAEACASARLAFGSAEPEADTTIAQGGIDVERIEAWSRSVVESLSATPDSRIAVYGEVAELLWRRGHAGMALHLERLWHDNPFRDSFQLLCTYPMGCFSTAADHTQFRELCETHDHVVPTENYTLESHAAQLRRISQLEQHEKALEAELEQRRELERRLMDALRERDELIQRERAARHEADAANRAKSDFLAVMNHELRTPLNAIAGYAELLEVGVAGPIRKEQREMLKRIQRSQRHLLAMIEELLTFARADDIGGDTIEAVDVIELVRLAHAQVAQQVRDRMITVEMHPTDAPISVRGNRSAIRRIIVNLLSNACKYTPAGGTVRLTFDQDEVFAFIRVHDYGIGIAPHHFDSIFEPFFQVDARLTRVDEGLGLGLSIARRLAIAMRGDVTVSSRKGHGSTFTLSLPRV